MKQIQTQNKTNTFRALLFLFLATLLVLTACGGEQKNGPTPEKPASSEAAQSTSANTASSEGANSASTETATTELEKRTYIVGLDDTFAPMGFRDDKNELVGFDIDLAKEISKRLGVEFKYQPIDWTTKEMELNNKSIDFIWNGYSITPERKEKVAFSTPYFDNRQIIVVLADSPIQSKADIAGKTITLQGESAALEAVNKDEAFVTALKTKPVEYASNNEAFADLEAKRADAMVVDEVLARYYMSLKGQEKYRVLEDNFGEEEFGIGMRKEDTALIKAVDDILAEMKKDGTFDTIYKKWFSVN